MWTLRDPDSDGGSAFRAFVADVKLEAIAGWSVDTRVYECEGRKPGLCRPMVPAFRLQSGRGGGEGSGGAGEGGIGVGEGGLGVGEGGLGLLAPGLQLPQLLLKAPRVGGKLPVVPLDWCLHGLQINRR